MLGCQPPSFLRSSIPGLARSHRRNYRHCPEVPPFLASRSMLRPSLCVPTLVLRHLRSSSLSRGSPVARCRSSGGIRRSGRSDRSNAPEQRWPETGARSACHYSSAAAATVITAVEFSHHKRLMMDLVASITGDNTKRHMDASNRS